MSVFPNYSRRICSIKLKISMLDEMTITFWDTFFQILVPASLTLSAPRAADSGTEGFRERTRFPLSFLMSLFQSFLGLNGLSKDIALREKWPDTEFFLVRIFWSEYGDLRSKSPYLVRIQENTDQKILRIWTLCTQCCFRSKVENGNFLKVSAHFQKK